MILGDSLCQYYIGVDLIPWDELDKAKQLFTRDFRHQNILPQWTHSHEIWICLGTLPLDWQTTRIKISRAAASPQVIKQNYDTGKYQV